MGARPVSAQPEISANDRETQYISDVEAIAATLRVFRDQRADLTLRVEQLGQPLMARVLDVSERELLIEDIRPRSAMSQLQPRQKCSATARIKGLYAFIEELRILSREEERGLPFYRVSLPKNMLVQQRRRAERFRIPMRVSTRGARVTLYRDAPLVGKILDISAGGLRAEFAAPKPLPQKGESVMTCAITIPNLLTLTSKAVVRHVQKKSLTNKYICGIELTEMPVTDRRRLEQFIQSLAKITTVS